MPKQNYIQNYSPENKKFKTIYNKLKAIAEDNYDFEIKVGLRVCDAADMEKFCIRLRKRVDEERMIFYLLHELGHMELFFSHEYNNQFKNMIKDLDARRYKTNAYRIGVLEEEILAWEKGKNLAKDLKFKLDYDKMEKEKIHCLKSYAKWAAK